MIQTINVSDLKPDQIKQIQAIIEAFKAKNQIDEAILENRTKTKDIIDYLTENPIKINGFLSRQEIYDRQS